MKRLLRDALVILAVSTAALHAQQSVAPYRLVPNWGVLPGGATWGEVPGMAIDANGKIFAFHRSEPPIVELDASGTILKMWGDKMFAWPHGIRVDRFGALWITDGRGRDGIGEQVFKFSADGKLLMTLGTKGTRGEGPDTFGGPCGFCTFPHEAPNKRSRGAVVSAVDEVSNSYDAGNSQPSARPPARAGTPISTTLLLVPPRLANAGPLTTGETATTPGVAAARVAICSH